MALTDVFSTLVNVAIVVFDVEPENEVTFKLPADVVNVAGDAVLAFFDFHTA